MVLCKTACVKCMSEVALNSSNTRFENLLVWKKVSIYLDQGTSHEILKNVRVASAW